MQKKRNLIYFIKKCPLLTMIIGSVLVLTLADVVGAAAGRYRLQWGFKHPLLLSVLLDEKPEREGPAKSVKDKERAAASADASKDAASKDAKVKDPAKYPGEMPRPMEYEDIPSVTPKSPYYDDPGRKPLTTSYPYVTVGDDYFDDALFIGDSRIEGLSYYGKLDKATFCYKQGLSVYDLLDADLTFSRGAKTDGSGKLDSLLGSKQFNKIYIMIGVNELGTGTPDKFADQYSKVLQDIRKREPDAMVMVMGIMNVTTKYSQTSDVFNNDNINSRNNAVSRYIDGVRTFYLDMNESVCGSDGGLNPDYTSDGIHLTAEYYVKWVDWMKAHGLQAAIFRNPSEVAGLTASSDASADASADASGDSKTRSSGSSDSSEKKSVSSGDKGKS